MSEKHTEKLENDALEALVAADLSQKIKAWRNPLSEQKPPRRSNRRWFWIGLLLLAGVCALWLKRPSAIMPENKEKQPIMPTVQPADTMRTPVVPQDPVAQKQKNKTSGTQDYRALAVAEYKLPAELSSVRSNNTTDTNWLVSAQKAIAEGRYEEAINNLNAAPAGFETERTYWAGHIAFLQKRFKSAATAFGQSKSSVKFGEDAQWYELLALLAQYPSSKQPLTARLQVLIQDKQHTYSKEIESLYKRIME